MIKKFNEMYIKESAGTNANEFSFVERTKDVSMFHFERSPYAAGLNIIEKDDYDLHAKEMVVEWEIDIQMKSWGLWHFQPIIKKVSGDIEVQVLNEDSDVINEKTIEFVSDDFKFETNLDVTEGPSDTLVTGVTIDFHTKIITADVQVCVQPQKAV